MAAPPVLPPRFPQVAIPPTVPQQRVTQPVIPVPTVPTGIRVPVPSPRVPVVTAPRVPVPSPRVPVVTAPRVQVITAPRVPTVPVPSPRIPATTAPIVPPVRVPVPSPRVQAPTLRVTVPTPTVPQPLTLVPAPRAQIPVPTGRPQQQRITFSPEMIDEATIIALANTLNQPNFFNLLEFVGDYYHNDEALISDERYDEIVAIYEAKYGPYDVVGAEPRGEMVNLPFHLGSLRKVKEEAELATWLANFPGPYIIQDKIDGLTLLIYARMSQGRLVVSAYSRGRKGRGKDLTHMLAYLPIPRITTEIAIRGELVMHKETFARVGGGYKNPRNLVSGIAGAKERFNPTLARELSFYAYRIITKNQSPEDDINELRALGFQVPNPVSATTLTKEILTNYYNTRQQQAPYEMDGLVIYQNRVGIYPDRDEPRHVVAFKTGTETAITTVLDVVWRGSMGRKLKPRVYYDTKFLSGADLNYASGYNARFIVDNGIGPGARILLTRSGDVIPKILSVIEPAPGGPTLPDPNVHGQYGWNENQVEFILAENNMDVFVGQLKHFLTTLGVKNAGRKRLESIVAAGIDNINDLLRVQPQQLEQIQGIGPTLSSQLYQDIHAAVTNVSLARIMDASGHFPGIGERRFEDILAVHPDLLDFIYLNTEEAISRIQEVRGIKTLAVNIMSNLPRFVGWLTNNPMITIERPRPVQTFVAPPRLTTLTFAPTQVPAQVPTQAPTGNRLAGQTIVFSGFRDRDLENQLKDLGARVTTSVSRNTTMLIIKDIRDKKGKALEAEAKGIPIISREEFIARYLG